jgi:hypothetical protein
MRYDTVGNEIPETIQCVYCRQNTAGNHEWNCPNSQNHKKWNMLNDLPISKEEYDYYEKVPKIWLK